MNTSEQLTYIVPTIFAILMVFVLFNLILFFTYLVHKRTQITAYLFAFWLNELLQFILSAFMDKGNLKLLVPFSLNILNFYILYRACFGPFKKLMNFKPFTLIFIGSWVLAIVNELLFSNFTLTTLPVALALNIPVVYLFYISFRDKEKNFTSIHFKWLFFIMGISMAHNINFAFFRDNPENILWGMTIHIVIVASFSVVLTNFHTIMLEREEKERLSSLVALKTQQLNDRLVQMRTLAEEKATLLKVVLHDISNPLNSSILALDILKRRQLSEEKEKNILANAYAANKCISTIIGQVRRMEAIKTGKLIKANEVISLFECLDDIEVIFQSLYQAKDISLVIKKTKYDVFLHGNKELFTHSVISNLLSNSLKFSLPNSTVSLTCEVNANNLIITIDDNGQGISSDKLQKIFDFTHQTSTKGTYGEVGTGFGMPLVKSYMDTVNGRIEIESTTKQKSSDKHGTKIKLYLPVVRSEFSSTPPLPGNELYQ